MKTTLLILFVFIFCTTIEAQKKINPSQEEWDLYIDNRVKDLQENIYNLAMQGKLTMFKRVNQVDSVYENIISSADTFTKEELILFISLPCIEMKKKGKVMVEVKTDIPMGPRDFSGLCFFGKQRNAAARTATRQSFTAIAFLIRPALAAGMRDENEYPICWFSAKKLFELLPPQDVSFLKRTFNLLVYARVNAIENNFSNEISYFVLENFLLNEGKGFRLDTISKDLLKALIRTQSSVFHNSPNAELYDVQQKRKVTYSPVFTESYFKKTSIEAIDEISFNSNVQTYKRVDISEPIVLPNSNTFEFKKGKVEKIFVYLDTTGKATSFDFQTKKSYYEFYYNREAIESNFLIKNLVWWLEDYYRYIKTQK